jgi:hypothetical protein
MSGCPGPSFIFEHLVGRRLDFKNVQSNIVSPGENLYVENIDPIEGKYPGDFGNKSRSILSTNSYGAGIGIRRLDNIPYKRLVPAFIKEFYMIVHFFDRRPQKISGDIKLNSFSSSESSCADWANEITMDRFFSTISNASEDANSPFFKMLSTLKNKLRIRVAVHSFHAFGPVEIESATVSK